MNTTEFLDIATAIAPDRLALVFEDKRFTFSQLSDRVNRLASALSELGVKKGDTIGLIQVNTNQCIESYFASAKVGAVYVPINFRARPNEFNYMINTAECKVILAGDRYVPILDGMRADLSTVEHFLSLDIQKEGWLNYEDLIAKSSDEPPYVDSDENDLTILMYTAGTTGFPKGVMLNHSSFTSYVLANVTPIDPDTHDSNILTVPLYHIAGIQAIMAAIYGGRTAVIERQFDPVEWMTLVETEKISRAMMVPTMLKQLMDHEDFRKHDLSSLKVITYGAAPMPLEVISKAIDEFPNAQFINAFGQTETAATITALAPEDHVIDKSKPGWEARLKRLSSVGKALADVEIKVVNEDGQDTPPGEVGEVIARGSRVMAGYWKDEAKTAQTKKGGWIYTGDLGYFDDDKYLFLSGRASDVIIRAGENISPEEVEAVLNQHPAVEESAVFGIEDVTWGELIAAAVVLRKEMDKPADTELIEFTRQRLSSYKKPEFVYFVDELPRNPMGKVLKRELKATYAQKQPAS